MILALVGDRTHRGSVKVWWWRLPSVLPLLLPMAAMTLVLHFPSNWAFEGSVDVLYIEPGGAERSYGTLVQGGTRTQQTYAGHRWAIRESASRELLMTVVAAAAAVTDQVVTIGSDPGVDPLKAAVWRMGTAPHEPLLQAVGTLTRVLGNVLADPAEDKYRSLRAANPKVSASLDVPGVLALLGCAGFEQTIDEGGEARLVLLAGRPATGVQDAAAQLKRLDALLRGLPPPPESLASMQQSQTAAAAAASGASGASAGPSHRCASCGSGIDNDLRAKMRGSGEVGGWRTHDAIGPGEYRFHCPKCNVDLCSKCFDEWKAAAASSSRGAASSSSSSSATTASGRSARSIHPLECTLTIEAPITTPWGASSYGNAMPPPPPVSSRNRRGPWG